MLEGDLRSYHIVREAVEGVDYILHQGALPKLTGELYGQVFVSPPIQDGK